MSNQISGDEKNIKKEVKEGNGEEVTNKLELLEVRDNKSAKTFVYRDPDAMNKNRSFWNRLMDKARSVE